MIDEKCKETIERNNILKRKLQELTVLYEISQLLISTPDPKDALISVLDILHKKMGMNRGTITLLNPTKQEITIDQHVYSLDSSSITLHSRLC